MKRAERERWESRAAAGLDRLLAVVPRPAALALGRGLGRLLADLDARHWALAADNLARAFPSWDESRVRRTARAVYAHFGQTLLDVLWLARRSREQVLSLVEVSGREHVEQAMAAGRGAVLTTAHLGSWELHGVVHGYLFGPIGVVARPLDNPDLDARLCAFRARGGNSVIYKRKALAQVLRALRAGGGVALLVDQNVAPGEGTFVRFFDRPAATTTVAAALALKTGAALIPCDTRLLPGGRYRLSYQPPLRPRPGADRQAEIARLTQELTGRLENAVRAAPEQWLWMHKRWRTQPAVAAGGEAGVAEARPPAAAEP